MFQTAVSTPESLRDSDSASLGSLDFRGNGLMRISSVSADSGFPPDVLILLSHNLKLYSAFSMYLMGNSCMLLFVCYSFKAVSARSAQEEYWGRYSAV